MGCKPIMEHYRRVVAALTLTLGVNGPLVALYKKNTLRFSNLDRIFTEPNIILNE